MAAVARARPWRTSGTSTLLQVCACSSLVISFMLIVFNHLVCLNELAPGELLVSIVCDELFNNHIATSYTDYQLTIHDLCEDFSGSKVIVAVAKSLNRYLALHEINISSQLLIYSITLISAVEVGPDTTSSLELLLRSNSILAHSLLQLLHLHVFLVKYPLQPIDLTVPHADLIRDLPYYPVLISNLSPLDLKERLHLLDLCLIPLNLSVPLLSLLAVPCGLILHVPQFNLRHRKPLTCLLLHHCQLAHQLL